MAASADRLGREAEFAKYRRFQAAHEVATRTATRRTNVLAANFNISTVTWNDHERVHSSIARGLDTLGSRTKLMLHWADRIDHWFDPKKVLPIKRGTQA
jgi:hypothetical protein